MAECNDAACPLFGKLRRRRAHVTPKAKRRLKRLLMSWALAAPGLKSLDVGSRRLAPLQVGDPFESLIEKRNSFALVWGIGHSEKSPRRGNRTISLRQVQGTEANVSGKRFVSKIDSPSEVLHSLGAPFPGHAVPADSILKAKGQNNSQSESICY